MTNPENLDPLFREAVAAIDAGDVSALERLLAANPGLVRERLDSPGDWLREQVGSALEGYFRQSYLLWFVAENPIRNDRLPANITQVTRAIIRAAERERVDSLREQLTYTLALVCTGRVACECGVQRELIDLLIDADGIPDQGNGAIGSRNLAAVEQLVERGAGLTLAAAICLDRTDDVTRLAREASAEDRQVALAAAALNGKAEALALLIDLGVDLNAYSTGIHPHATALHHAVDSGSLDAVKVLVEAGAELGTRDRIYQGTPRDWAEHLGRAEIGAYLREKEGRQQNGGFHEDQAE
ncbi:MAG TPA: ankyrin repeat domain-containing protein [Thermoanaerobaculia bacterium]|jgi:peptide-methionine (S)-S-oxide reductase|nr:ankyrin repeat domain-containing protein [Thermoanaerobaculia bacterium]